MLHSICKYIEMKNMEFDCNGEKVRPSMSKQRQTILLGNIPTGTLDSVCVS